MKTKKKMVSKRGGLIILDNQAREVESKKAEGTSRNEDNANADMELSPNLALTANVESAVPMNSSMKRSRGRPRGSGKLQVLSRIGGEFAETAGGKLFHHFLEVLEGADLASILKAYFESTSRAVFVKSAIGKVSNVTLRPPRRPSGAGYTIRFEGICEIVSLTGTFKQKGENSSTRPVGTLTISVARANGEVVGGFIAGPLIAVTPIQVVLGIFEQEILKERKKYRRSNDSRWNANNHNDRQIVEVSEHNSKTPDHDNPNTADDSSEATVDDNNLETTEEDNEASTTPAESAGSKEADTVMNDKTSTAASPKGGELELQVWKTEENNEVSTISAASAVLEAGSKEADTAMNDQTSIAASPKSGELELQVWKPPTDEEVNYETSTTPILALDHHYKEADTVVVEKETTFLPAASPPLSISDYTVQDDAGNFDILMPQHLSIHGEEADQGSIPASPHGVGGFPMEAWSPPPADQTIAPDAAGSPE